MIKPHLSTVTGTYKKTIWLTDCGEEISQSGRIKPQFY
jgi:hypothetical protein